MLVLGVPCECQTIKAVGESYQATVPIGVMHVEPYDAKFGQTRQTTLRSVFHGAQSGRIDNSQIVVTNSYLFEAVEIFTAQIGVGQSMRSSEEFGTYNRPCIRLLDIERESKVVMVGEVQQVTKRGNMRRQLISFERADVASTETRPNLTVVVKDRNAVLGDPDVGFDPCCPQSNGQLKGGNGVLSFVRTSTSMRKEQWWLQE